MDKPRIFLGSPGGYNPAARPIDPAKTTYALANDLASALRRAEAAHGQHEQRARPRRAGRDGTADVSDYSDRHRQHGSGEHSLILYEPEV